MAALQFDAVSAVRQDFLGHALHLDEVFFRHRLKPPYHVNPGGAPANGRFVQLISNQLMLQGPRRLHLDEVPDIGHDIVATRIRPDLTDAF
ncbi:hypothetical protein [Pseudoduganella ginsengisoli]|uniref:hypothetical protein n=1 Tax=Pseudoduganella ginsengisoli TaxID=1462440 RepID=UPI001479699D|nr:hypothetical protein [Pseudoduganella ginsengisoli]